VLAAVSLTACQAAQSPTPAGQLEALARPEPIAVAGVYTHRYTSAQFPPTIENFNRTELLKYDAQAIDVSATYRRSGPPGSALETIHIYPAPWIQGTGYPDLTDRQLGGLCRHRIGLRREYGNDDFCPLDSPGAGHGLRGARVELRAVVLGDDELLTHVILPPPGNVKSGHYEVRYKDNLTDADWQLLTTVSGDGSVKTYATPIGSGKRFFTVKTL